MIGEDPRACTKRGGLLEAALARDATRETADRWPKVFEQRLV